MASPKWFDLSGHEAKIERIGQGRGVFVLRLELPNERLADLDDAALLDAGWVEEDQTANGRRVLVNHRTLTDMRSIADSLTGFFSRDEIVAARASQDMMKQNEQMDGLTERRIIEEVDLAEQVSLVDVGDRDRIIRAVMGAASEQRKRIAAEKGVPLNGRGLLVYQDVVERLSAEFSEQSSAEAAVSFLAKIGRGKTDDVDPQATADYSAAERYLRAKDGQDDDAVRKALDLLSERVIEAHHGTAPGQPASATPELANQPVASVVFDRAVSQGGISVPMIGGVDIRLSERRSVESILDALPFKVVRDNSMATRDLANYAAALTQATEAVAERLGLEPDDLIPDQKNVPLRFNVGNIQYGRDEVSGVMLHKGIDGAGTVNDSGDVKRGAITIAVSLRRPGSFIHELAHAIDFGNSFSKEARETILERSGLLAQIQGEIANHYQADNPFGQYLRAPHEIFARVFETAMVHHALQKADPTLESIGGLYAAKVAEGFAARGDFSATDDFLALISEELRTRRSRAYETARGLESDVPLAANKPVPALSETRVP